MLAAQSPPETTPPKAILEKSPLHHAEEALQQAEFERLRLLLSPFIDSAPFQTRPPSERARARALYALGLYFDAQQHGDERAQELLTHARAQLQVALIEHPEHTLDPLVFPAALIEMQQGLVPHLPLRVPGSAVPGQSETLLYVERQITHRSPWVALLPGGAGQFQNGHPIRGSVFAGLQVLGLAANIAGYRGVEQHRGEEGLIAPGVLDAARQWRTVQWTGLGVAAVSWALSIAHALVHFESERVHVRTLDAPPPELMPQR